MSVFKHASSKSRWQTAVCLALILAAALAIARSLKFTTQVDCTLPAVLLDENRETGVPTTMRIRGELVRQWGEDDRFTGSLELEDQPATAASETSYVTLSMSPWPYDTRLKEGSVYYHTLTDLEVFGELYTDRKYERFFLFPYQQTPGEESGKHIHFPDSPIYVAPASSVDEALALIEPHKEGLWQ